MNGTIRTMDALPPTTTVQRIGRASFWTALSRPHRATLVHAGTVRTFEAGAQVLRERDRPEHVLIIRRGCVKVVSRSVDGRLAVLAVRGPGDVIGEIGGLAGTPRTASVVAIGDVEALVVPAHWFERFVRTQLEASAALQATLATRLCDADRSRTSAMVDSVDRRLASVLLDLAERYGEPTAPNAALIDLPLSHDDIAGLVLTSVRTLDRVLVRLRRDAILVTGRRAILLKDLAKLRELAGPPDKAGL
jgi:CRP-like cAMP-binding protein